MRQSIPAIAGPVLVAAAALTAWQAATGDGWIDQLILPSPAATLAAFVTYGPELARNALTTAVEALSGLVIGNAIGLLLAVLFVHSALSRRTAYPLAMAAQSVPIVAVAPALIIWLGNGMAPKIVVTSFLVFFPMLVNALRGLRSADGEVDEMLFVLSASAWQRLWLVRLPAALPFVFTALKVSACACFVAAIVSEWVAADRGLGYLIVFAGSQYRTDEVWAAVLIGTVLSMATVSAVVLAEFLATPWRRS